MYVFAKWHLVSDLFGGLSPPLELDSLLHGDQNAFPHRVPASEAQNGRGTPGKRPK